MMAKIVKPLNLLIICYDLIKDFAQIRGTDQFKFEVVNPCSNPLKKKL